MNRFASFPSHRWRGTPPDAADGHGPGAAAPRRGRWSGPTATSTGASTSAEFPAELLSVRRARHFTAGVLIGWHLEQLVDDVQLVVSELATNALLHAGSAFRVEVSRRGDGVRVAVTDTGEGAATPRLADAGSTTGRGLALVAALATAWGEAPSPQGKVVWAELGPPGATR